MHNKHAKFKQHIAEPHLKRGYVYISSTVESINLISQRLYWLAECGTKKM